MQILFWVSVTIVGGITQASIATAKSTDPSPTSTCGHALQTFPTTRPRGIYPSGFKSRGKTTIAAIVRPEDDHQAFARRFKVQDLAGMKLGELMHELHEAGYVVARRAAPLTGIELSDMLEHANHADSVRGLVDRAVAHVVRNSEFSLSPFFDEMRVILGDLSQWYQGNFARIALLRALAKLTEYNPDFAPQQGVILSALASEIADLGPPMKDAEFRELQNVTNQLLAQDATLARPARRFMFVMGLIKARLAQNPKSRGPLGDAYLEFLFNKLGEVEVSNRLLAEMDSNARVMARKFFKDVVTIYRSDRQFLMGYDMDSIYQLADRFE